MLKQIQLPFFRVYFNQRLLGVIVFTWSGGNTVSVATVDLQGGSDPGPGCVVGSLTSNGPKTRLSLNDDAAMGQKCRYMNLHIIKQLIYNQENIQMKDTSKHEPRSQTHFIFQQVVCFCFSSLNEYFQQSKRSELLFQH